MFQKKFSMRGRLLKILLKQIPYWYGDIDAENKKTSAWEHIRMFWEFFPYNRFIFIFVSLKNPVEALRGHFK